MKTKFDLFFMLDIMFIMLITQVSSSQQIEGDSYYYSIIDDNKKISDDWGIFQSVFLAILLIGLIFLWVENSGEEQAETSENRAANDIVLRTSRNSVSTQSELQAQTKLTPQSEPTPESEPSTRMVPLTPLPTGSGPRSPRSRSEPPTSVPRTKINLNRCIISPITIVIDDSEPNLTAEKSKSVSGTPPTPKIRSLICAPKRLNENGDSSPKPKTKLRRSLRFCEPEKPDTPLRRSLRLNQAKNPTQLNSSELLYCTEWCEKHSQDRGNRSKSIGRISPGKKQK